MVSLIKSRLSEDSRLQKSQKYVEFPVGARLLELHVQIGELVRGKIKEPPQHRNIADELGIIQL